MKRRAVFSGGPLSPRAGSLALRATSFDRSQGGPRRGAREAPGSAGRVALGESDPPERHARGVRLAPAASIFWRRSAKYAVSSSADFTLPREHPPDEHPPLL